MHLEDIDISESQETWKYARDARDEGLRMVNGKLAEAKRKVYATENMKLVKKRRELETRLELKALLDEEF